MKKNDLTRICHLDLTIPSLGINQILGLEQDSLFVITTSKGAVEVSLNKNKLTETSVFYLKGVCVNSVIDLGENKLAFCTNEGIVRFDRKYKQQLGSTIKKP